MAYYAALVSLLQLLKEINHHQRPYPKSLLGKQQIHASLYEKLSHLHELLEEYSPKDINKEEVDFLERQIRDAAYHAQDIVEFHISKKIPRRNRNRRVNGIVQQLQKVKEEVGSIVEELMRIKVESLTTHQDNLQVTYDSANSVGVSTQAAKDGSSFGGVDSTAGTSKVQAPTGRSTMVGFGKYLITIKDQLCGQSSERKVISIAGMGGIGKTTLARHIFDDKLIDYHFDCRACITVSQDYHLLNILLAIVKSLNIKKKELHGDGKKALKEKIYKHLKMRRYLIILDDVWDMKVWDDIKMALPDDYNGSRIMITTRQSDLAFYASTSTFIHHISLLNERQSWNLFSEKVSCRPELKDVGRMIATNCRGLPLAIVVVAGILSKPNMTRHNWEETARSVSSTVAENDGHFSKILSLSYNHLPHHLKPCFLYLGGFPEDYEVRVSTLIRLWVAEGFLKPIESKSLEEVAEQYLEELVNRNLVLITKWGHNGKFKCCNIHDLLRDLCSERARYEKFHFIYKYEDFHEESIRNARRLYIHPNSSFPKFNPIEYVSDVRSILAFNYAWDHCIPDASLLLRVLYALDKSFAWFPDEVFKLSHLRYLALGHCQFNIPPSISKLQNLQTLIVVPSLPYETSEISLPSEIWMMRHIRHVIIDKVRLPPIPHGGRTIRIPLLMLQTLYTLVDFRFTRNNVEMIPNLKKLKISLSYFQQSGNPWEKFGLENLVHLRQLEKLEIAFDELMTNDFDFESKFFENIALPERFDLPENFAFPLSLKKLTLFGCMLPRKDMRAVSLLPNLQLLKLRWRSLMRISDDNWEIIEGEFPKLKFLLIENIEFFTGENMSFPCLERLIMRVCHGLKEEIPSTIGDVPTLELIELEDCSAALESSALRIQQEQQDLGNNILQVRIHNYRCPKYRQEEDEAQLEDDEAPLEKSLEDEEMPEEGWKDDDALQKEVREMIPEASTKP